MLIIIFRIEFYALGTQAGCNQWVHYSQSKVLNYSQPMYGCFSQVGELEPERLGRAYVFLNKVGSALLTPYVF